MRVTLTVIAAIALIAGSAQALDVNGYLLVDPSQTETGFEVGVTAEGHLEVVAGGTITATTDLINIGAGFGGTLTVGAGATINADGNYYWPPEQEHHSIDIGAEADAVATFGAGAVINAKECMGIGMDYTWAGHLAAADVTFESGCTINSGWIASGMGESEGHVVIVRTKDLTVNGTLFHIGGTLVIEGTLTHSGGFRSRNYADDPNTLERRTFIKMKGAGALLDSANGLQFMTRDANDLGPAAQIDLSEYVVPQETWTTIMDGTRAVGTNGYWPIGQQKVALKDGTDLYTGAGDTGWLMRIVHWNHPTDPAFNAKRIDVQYIPEPVTLVLLGLGSVGALLRKRR